MEEAPTDELNQWASFSSFDFTTVTPVITQSAGQWPPFVKEELIDGEEESRNGQLEEIAQSRQNSFDESILDGSGDAGSVYQTGEIACCWFGRGKMKENY